MAEGSVVTEQLEKVMEKAEVEVPSQMRVSIQPAAFSAQERVEVRQPGSPNVLMSASQVAELSLTIGPLNDKVSITEVSLV